MEFPFHLQEEQAHVFYSLIHGKPILGGFFNAFPPPQYRNLKLRMANFPDAASLVALKELPIEYVVVDTNAYSDLDGTISRLGDLGLELKASFDEVSVFTWPEN